MEGQENAPKAPDWQRAICGFFSAAGLLTLGLLLWFSLESEESIGHVLLVLAGQAWGTFLFGFIAIKGRLPR